MSMHAITAKVCGYPSRMAQFSFALLLTAQCPTSNYRQCVAILEFNMTSPSVSKKLTASKTPIASSIPAASLSIHQSVFDALPDSAWVRESQLVRSSRSADSAVAPLPFSAPTLWRKVAAGTFPKPSKLSERVTCWNVGQVRAWLTAQAAA